MDLLLRMTDFVSFCSLICIFIFLWSVQFSVAIKCAFSGGLSSFVLSECTYLIEYHCALWSAKNENVLTNFGELEEIMAS